VQKFSAAQWLKFGDTGRKIFTVGRQFCPPLYSYFRPWCLYDQIRWTNTKKIRPECYVCNKTPTSWSCISENCYAVVQHCNCYSTAAHAKLKL